MKHIAKILIPTASAVLVIIYFAASYHAQLTEKLPEDKYVREQNDYLQKTEPTEEPRAVQLRNIPSGAQIYAEQISRYYLPFSQTPTHELCLESGLSLLLPLLADSDPLQNIGFSCLDLNTDGQPELIIGSTAAADPAILELWAVVDGKPKMIVQADMQNRYYLHHSEDRDSILLENSTGTSGKENACFYFTFNGTHLEYLWDTFPDIHSTRQEAMHRTIAEQGGVRFLPDYTPYSALLPT